jgi:hypothetical protein
MSDIPFAFLSLSLVTHPCTLAKDFYEELHNVRAFVEERTKTRLASFVKKQAKLQTTSTSTTTTKSRAVGGDSSPQQAFTADSEIKLLFEIGGAYNVPMADRNTSDPYIIVFLGKKEIHRTKPISNS